MIDKNDNKSLQLTIFLLFQLDNKFNVSILV